MHRYTAVYIGYTVKNGRSSWRAGGRTKYMHMGLVYNLIYIRSKTPGENSHSIQMIYTEIMD